MIRVIPMVLALACAATHSDAMDRDMAATQRALGAQLETGTSWSDDQVVYLDSNGLPIASGAPVPAQPAPGAPVPTTPAGGADTSPPAAVVPAVAAAPVAAGPPADAMTYAMWDLSRSLDEHRQTLILEARLEDKQVQIDALAAQVNGGNATPSRGADSQRAAAQSERVAALERDLSTAQATAETLGTDLEVTSQALAASQAELEAANAQLADQELARVEQETLAAAREQTLQEQAAMQAAELAQLEAERARLAESVKDLEARNDDLAKAERFERKQTRQGSRWERWTWWLNRKDARQDERRADKEARYHAKEQALADAAAAGDAEAYRAQLNELEQERDRLAAEHTRLSDERAALAAEKSALSSELASSQSQQTALLQHIEALQAAEDAAGSMDAARQAEIMGLETELDVLRAKEAELASLEQQLIEVTASEAALKENQAELEALRVRAAEAEGMEQELQRMEAERAAQAQRWATVLAPMEEAGLQVQVAGDTATVRLPSDILFASGSARLSKDGSAALDEVAALLASVPGATIQVQGHTDDVPVSGGRYKTNWDLAYARAQVVLDGLVEAGVPAAQVSAASFGDTRPVATNATQQGRDANRRIELVLTLEE